MAIQIGTVDGLITITKDNFKCFTSAIYDFSQKGGIEYAVEKGISFGAAFQRYVEPVYTGKSKDFDITSIESPVYTKGGKEQSPARGTFCRKMGLLNVDDSRNVFQLTPIALELYSENLTIEEYAFVLMTKQGIFKDGIYVQNLFTFIADWFDKHTIISESDLKLAICETYSDYDVEKTRIDIILNAFALCGLIVNIGAGKYVLASIPAADIFKDFLLNNKRISNALRDDDSCYTNYIGSIEYGIFDILSFENSCVYTRLYPNLCKYIKSKMDKIHQQIFYGAPGTGKSHKIKSEVDEKHNICYRTTFHPDSDYSTFVGAYKPSMKPTGTILASGEKEEIIKYTFVPQAFTKAYVHAWNTKDEVYLVIEEINRGNCAQIFGDLFQLLDRKNGFSEYPIDADSDLEDHIKEKLETSTRDDIPEQVRAGKKLMLPSNLYIWATMNTSDQSLFPIDSAFKRRWDWVYTPIKQHDEEYKIVLGDDAEYDWWGFLEKINQVIDDATSSEDKQLGYFFVKAQDKVISAEKFVGKVLFYLWNDVFKNYGFDSPIFSKGENKKFTFSDFFTGSGEPDTEMVKSFLKKLDETIDKEKPFTNDKSKVAVNPEEVAE